MKVQLTFDSQAFKRDINQLRVLLKKDGPQMVRDEARLFVRDAMKMTPPFGRHAISGESWADQRRIGMETVKWEIFKLFKPVLWHAKGFNQRALRYLKGYIASRNKTAIRTMFKDFGIETPVILDEATAQVHDSARDSKGRVQKGVKYLVCDEKSINKLVEMRQAHIGKGKAGWMVPANALGVKVPKWISKHAGPGVWNDQTGNMNYPYVDVGNLVPHANEAGSRMGIVQSAMTNRRRSIRIRIDKMLRNMKRKAS